MQYFYALVNDPLTDTFYVSWAGKQKYAEAARVGPKVGDTYMLFYVVSGRGYLWQGAGDGHFLEAGNMFLLFPGIKYSYYTEAEDPWEVMWVAFNGTLCEKILLAQGITEQSYCVMERPCAITKSRMETLVEAMGDETDIHKLETIGNLMLLFSHIGRYIKTRETMLTTDLSRQEIVPAAIAFIERYYYIHLDVDILCKHIKYSRSYLSRLFNKECGMAIPEYINHVRIQHAQDLFEHTTLSVQEVSASVGIPDSFYFSKTFKKIVGMAPNQYRKQFSGRGGRASVKVELETRI